MSTRQNKDWPSKGKEDWVQLVPRSEDGMYFFEVYLHGEDGAGGVFSVEGEAYHAAEELAEKYGRKINVWRGWW